MTPSKKSAAFWMAVAIGVLLRFSVSLYGHNFDWESWQIAARAIREHQNIYVATFRYPYAPVWCHILAFLEYVGSKTEIAHFGFRQWVISFLTLTDMGLAWLLVRRHRATAAALLMLSPISVIISGYHNQFDNLALLLALVSAHRLETGACRNEHSGRSFWTAMLLLGLSLAVKHVFLFFPVWLAFRNQSPMRRLLCLLIPFAIFFSSFAPYWGDGHEQIVRQVFLYRSFDNGPFCSLFLPPLLQALASKQLVFYAAMLFFGYLYRRKGVFESAIHYCALLLIFSSALANQYLAIPVAFTSLYPNAPNLLYNLVGGLFLMASEAGLNISWTHEVFGFRHIWWFGHGILVMLLLVGWIQASFSKESLAQALRRLRVLAKDLWNQ